MARKKHPRRKRKVDPVTVQIGLKVPKIPGVRFSRKVIRQAIDLWRSGQELPPGFQISRVVWTNPNRRGGPHIVEADDEESIQQALQTIPYIRSAKFRYRLSKMG